jgi:hypothetical protein
MRNRVKLIIVGIILFAISLSFLVWQSSNNCSIKNLDKCNKSCNVDSDCHTSNCYAVNINEEVNSCSGFFPLKSCSLLGCELRPVKCMNNTCQIDIP